METVQISKNIDLPIDHILSNVVTNTQPENILKYKYVYGRYNSNNWIKMFIVPSSVRHILFQGALYQNIEKAILLSIGEKKYTKIKIYIPDLLFVIVYSGNCDSIANLHVYTINGSFDPNDLSNITPAPLPNLYDSGQVCQSGQISISKMCKNMKSHILKNSFDICEYYIDMFLNSAFNSDLNSTFEKTLINLGFCSIYDYIETASDPTKFMMLKEKYTKQSPICDNNLFKDKFMTPDKKKKIYTEKILFEDNYIQIKNINDKVDMIFINKNKSKNSISIGEYIKYNDKFVKVISFGPNVTSAKSFVNLPKFTNDHNIKYLSDDNKIGFINFSEIKEKVQLEQLTEVTEYPDFGEINDFVYTDGKFCRIVGIYKKEKNNQYYFKLATFEYNVFSYKKTSESLKYDIVKAKEFNTMVFKEKDKFSDSFYNVDEIYHSHRIQILSVNTKKKYSRKYLYDNIMTYRENMIILNEDNSHKLYNINNFVHCDFLNDLNTIENDHIITKTSFIPNIKELKYKDSSKNVLYGENIDKTLFSNENINFAVKKLIKQWNETGCVKNINIDGSYDEGDILYSNCFRLPILFNYYEKHMISSIDFIDDHIGIICELENLESKSRTQISLYTMLYHTSKKAIGKNNSFFKSESLNDDRYIGKYISIKKSAIIESRYIKEPLHDKTVQIIDIDFSSDKYNKFYTSDNTVYHVNKNKDPFYVFDIMKKTDFDENDNSCKIMTERYVNNEYISENRFINDTMLIPKYNNVFID